MEKYEISVSVENGVETFCRTEKRGEYYIKHYFTRHTSPAGACAVHASTYIWHIPSRRRIFYGGGINDDWISSLIEDHAATLMLPRFGIFHSDPLGKPDTEPEAVFDDEKEACEYADLLNSECEPYNAGTDDNPSWRSHSYFVSELD